MQGALQFIPVVEVVGVTGLPRLPPPPGANFRTTNSAAVLVDWIKAAIVPSWEIMGEVETAYAVVVPPPVL